MTWRGSTTIQSRIFSALFYLLPLVWGFSFGVPLFTKFEIFRGLALVLMPLVAIEQLPFLDLIIFFAVFFLVVRNDRVPHIVRFNAMQAILIGIVLFLIELVWGFVFAPLIGGGFITETIFNVIFLGTLAICIYGVAQSLSGRYAEIPTISEAAYIQVR